MNRNTARTVGIWSSVVGILFSSLLFYFLYLIKSTFQGCNEEETLFFLQVVYVFSVIFFFLSGVGSLFAHKKSKIPGIFMLVFSGIGFFPLVYFLLESGFYCSTISIGFIRIAILLLPFIGILYASALNLFAKRLESTPKEFLHRQITVFTGSFVVSFIALPQLLSAFSICLDYDLINPNNVFFVIALYLILLCSGIGLITGSCLWLKNRHKAGLYTLLPCSLVGLASITTVLFLFKDQSIIHIFLFIALLIVLLETLLLRKYHYNVS